jgi:hypothetical protein
LLRYLFVNYYLLGFSGLYIYITLNEG